ncbi:MAG TPA: helix-turn-helix transcriptional regulator [Acetobacteraceae bacterium]|nr:helix-turn-helix transcriptional regulator [Acetobacteraceae bacterium]
MRLRAYLDKHGLTATAFAERVRVSHSTILRLAEGRQHARPKLIQAIFDETNGEVTADDLYAAVAERTAVADEAA